MADEPQQPRSIPKLTAVQRRVLGVLIEKSLTTPGSYPLTVNSLVTGCNQLSCREPVMQLSENEVGRALHELQTRREGPLARQAPVDRTARANRFEHLAEQRFAWDQRERAIMAELLLRGPQTPGELKSNASRMATFDDLQIVLNILDHLSRHEPPYVHELSRQPGKSVARFDHLLYAEGSGAHLASENASGAAFAGGSIPPADRPPAAVPESREPVWEDRVARLEAQVFELQSQMRRLQQELGVTTQAESPDQTT